MRYLLLFSSFIPALLFTCPFANGTYKKKPKNLETFKGTAITSLKGTLNFQNMQLFALNQYRSLYEKAGYSCAEDLQVMPKRHRQLSASLTQLFNSLVGGSLKSSSKEYRHYLTALRRVCEAIQSSKLRDEELKNKINLLCRLHFEMPLDPMMQEVLFFEQALASYPAPGKYNEVSIDELNHYFSTSLKLHPAEKWLRGVKRQLKGPVLKEWDSAQVSLRFSWGHLTTTNKEIKVLRTGCPILLQNNHLKVDPLFIAYLNELRSEGKKHLYINLMNQSKAGWEKEASSYLKQISFSQDMQGTFYYISLPYNGSFYLQESLTCSYTKEFIKDFKDSILNGKNGFYFPSFLTQDPSFQKAIDETLNSIHTNSFDGKASLTQRERWQFIDLAYAHLSTRALEALQVESVNWTCRHGIDRAMSAFTVFERLHQKEIPDPLKNSIFYAYLPSFIFYSRAPVPYHAMRTLAALEKIEEKGIVDLPSISSINIISPSNIISY